VKKLAIATKRTRLQGARLEGAMASKGEQRQARPASRGEALASAVDDMTRLLPWWSKLVHQNLLAEAPLVLDKSREESHECEDRYVASGAAGVCVRAAVDGSAGP
jgi:hypothetical protein